MTIQLRSAALLALLLLLGACTLLEKTRMGKAAPIPTRLLNVKTECSFHDEAGIDGALTLDVAKSKVNDFKARVNIPNHGTCRFAFSDFRQTKEAPNVELSQINGRCIVRMWEQNEHVTVAFDQCEQMCSGGAFDWLLPIIHDRQDGSCA